MRKTFPWINKEQGRWVIAGLVVVFVVICTVQLLYPRDTLVPFMSIDGVNVGGLSQQDAIKELDNRAANQQVLIMIKGTDKAYQTIKPRAIGVTTSNQQRVKAAGYPLWARLLPTSITWYQLIAPRPEPVYKRNETELARFMKDVLGDCKLAPKNAGIVFTGGALKLVPATAGGTCDKTAALNVLRNVEPGISEPSKVNIEVKLKDPAIDDTSARHLIQTLTSRTKNGIKLKVAGKTKVIPQKEVLSWMDFTAKKDVLVAEIDEKRSDDYFTKHITPLVAVAPGTTKVTTRDFTETGRTNGKAGRTLDTAATRALLLGVLEGKTTEAEAAVRNVKPNVSYTRSYTKSSVGMAALLAHYDQDNPGVFGVSFVELGGQRRSAAHNESRVFTTASTYKLFVAFSTLRQVEGGKYKWSDSIVSGRDLSTCFDDMIVKSDNACAEALLEKIGRKQLDEDLRLVGLTRSTFRAASNQTTAGELALFLTKLEKGELPIKPSSRDLLLGAMKRQQYRQGIPAGAVGAVADKVGFLEGLLHDAAIVYSPKGTYVLVILSDGSSWANLAELTKKIESLR